jgi:hypothetical protein
VRCKRASAITGVGALTTDALVAMVGSAQEFRNGRQMSLTAPIEPFRDRRNGASRRSA